MGPAIQQPGGCDHPPDKRWQYRVMWLCCRCYRHFWGDKRETPAVDIYGRAT
jgi:hypothetical protein